jgi:predicted MFS family arabinose efflux permease
LVNPPEPPAAPETAGTPETRNDGSGQDPAQPPVSRAYSNYVLGVLFLVYVFNFIDRQILATVLEDIKRDFEISDSWLGFLTGTGFALFYTLAGIPIARLADRTSRRNIVAVGLLVWSFMTLASGLARSFSHLLLARLGVGIGEAAGSPPSHSLISDYFPPERRTTALAIYATGIYLGAMIAFLAGGYVREVFDWRTAFFIVGAPGIFLTLLLLLTVREPRRGLSEHTRVDTTPVSTREVARFLYAQRSFRNLVLAGCCQSLSGYAFLTWAFSFLLRVHEMSSTQVGLWLGLVVGIGGASGAYLGGVIADRLGARDARWYLWLSAIVSLAGAPFGIGFLLIPDATSALICFIPFYVLGAMYVGPLWSMTQSLAKVPMRATASAILLFILNIVGLGLGPQLIGWLNDGVFSQHGVDAIRYSLCVVAIVGALAALFFMRAARTLREDLATAAR